VSEMPRAIQIDIAHGVWLGSRRLYDHYVGLTDDWDYRLTIDGYDIALTEAQFTSMHKARIQVWDDGAKAEQERIIGLLRNSISLCDKNKEPGGCDACYGQRHAIELIKGEQK